MVVEKRAWAERFSALKPVAWGLSIARNATWLFVHKSWVAAVILGAATIGGVYFVPRFTAAVLAGLFAVLLVQMIAWQTSLRLATAVPVGYYGFNAIRIKKWYAPRDAVTQFCSRSLLEQRERAASALLTEEDNAASSVGNLRINYTDKADVGMVLSARGIKEDARWAYIRAEVECWKDLSSQLSNGLLLAKGLKMPFVIGDPDTVIPPHEWRLLQLDINYEHARIQKEAAYYGVVIGKP